MDFVAVGKRLVGRRVLHWIIWDLLLNFGSCCGRCLLCLGIVRKEKYHCKKCGGAKCNGRYFRDPSQIPSSVSWRALPSCCVSINNSFLRFAAFFLAHNLLQARPEI